MIPDVEWLPLQTPSLLIGVLLFSYRRRTAFGFDGELVQSAKTRQRIFCSIPAI